MKRRFLIVAIFLLAGAVVNVAVAWRCATRSPVKGTLSIATVPEPGYVVVDRAWHGFGVTITVGYSVGMKYHVDLNVTSGWPLSSFIEESWQHYQTTLDDQTFDFMLSTDSVAGETLSDEEMAEIVKSGEYELPSDEYARRFYETVASIPYAKDTDGLVEVMARHTNEGLFILERGRLLRDATYQVHATHRGTSLPRLLWPGFAINTLFYAAVLWLLISGPFVLRRLIRIRRGLCPKCACPMGEAGVCRECGGDAMKRRLLVAGVFLLVGVVVNVAVAWGCALTSFDAETERARGVDDSMMWQVERISSTGTVVFLSRRMRHRGAFPPAVEGNPAELLDDWTGFAVPTPEFESGESLSEMRAASGRGLPMLALWCETTRGRMGQIRGGIDTDALPLNHWLRKTPARRFLANPRVLPLRPLWPGFIINTLFYGAVLWMLIPGPFALRRFLRVKRGQCVKCGYPLGESATCSECGNMLPTARR